MQDFKENIIKNKYIFLLFLLFIPYAFLQSFNALEIFYSFIIFLSLGVILFSFCIWGAGDAKYLLVLSLYLSQNSIFSFIGNIGVVTTFMLIVFLAKNIFIKNNNGEYLHNIVFQDMKSKMTKIRGNLEKSKNDVIFSIMNTLNTFFLVFIIVRLIRFFLIEKYGYIYIQNNQIQIVPIILSLWVGILLFIYIRKGFHKIKKKILISSSYNVNDIHSIGNIVFFIVALLLLYIDYSNNSEIFFVQMYRIFTLYLFIYVIVKVCIYIYRKTFIDMERKTIDVNKLQVGDIIDKTFFAEKIEPISGKKFFQKNMNSMKDVENIKKIINEHYSDNPNITIAHTFAFSFVIFLGCMITFLYDDIALIYLYNKVQEIFFIWLSHS